MNTTELESPSNENMEGNNGINNSSMDSSIRRSGRKKTPKKEFSIDRKSNPKSYTENDTPSTAGSTPSPLRDRSRRRSSSSPQKRRSSGSPSSSSLFHGEFYAVRKGNGCEGCIFLNWDQAKPHVIGQNAEFSVFDRMEDAILYIKTPPQETTYNPQKKRKRTATMGFTTGAGRKKKAAVPTHNLMLPPKEPPAEGKQPAKRAKKSPVLEPRSLPTYPLPEDSRALTDILHEGYAENKPKGWRASFLFQSDRQDRATWEACYLQDLATLKDYRTKHYALSREVHSSGHISGIPNAFSLAYLNWAWGVGEAYHRYLAFQQRKRGATAAMSGGRNKKSRNRTKSLKIHRGSNHPSCNTCVITDRDAARKRFTARAMFASFRVQQLAQLTHNGMSKEDLPGRPDSDIFQGRQSPLLHGSSRKKQLMDEARLDYDTLSDEDKAYWEEQERIHDERHPEILAILQDAIVRNPKRSAHKLSQDIGYWCGKTTIGKWKLLQVGPTYKKTGKASNSLAIPDGSASNSKFEVSLPISKYEIAAHEDDEDGGDDDEEDDESTFGDGSDTLFGDDDADTYAEDVMKDDDNREGALQKSKMAEEKKQFLAKVVVAPVKREDSVQLPYRIAVSTNKYIDNHISALVVSPTKSDISTKMTELQDEEDDDDEHLVI